MNNEIWVCEDCGAENVLTFDGEPKTYVLCFSCGEAHNVSWETEKTPYITEARIEEG